MAKRQFRIALVIVVSSLLLVGGISYYFINKALSYPHEKHSGEGIEVEVEVKPGMSFPRIAKLLHQKGIIDKPRWFRMYAMHRGVTTKVRSGKYLIRDDQTPKQVLNKLIEGVKDITIKVTIPEGLHMLEIFAVIEKARHPEHPELSIAKASELEALGRNRQFLEKLGIDGDTADGYLFPETYRFRPNTKPEKVIRTLVRQFRIVWEQVRRKNAVAMATVKKTMKWTDHELLTMASIVEKEAVKAHERPRIAQVFINRLRFRSFKPKLLQTDPTIRYGCMVPLEKSAACKKWDPSKRLRRAQLDDKDNPYNSYAHEGLPPGPISNPGRSAIEATANPDGSKYLYFVSKDDKTHIFSRTRREHERAVKAYVERKFGKQ